MMVCVCPAYEILKGVELAAANVEVPADGRHTEVVDACPTQVGQHVGTRLPTEKKIQIASQQTTLRPR
jgi:hypothetical protein